MQNFTCVCIGGRRHRKNAPMSYMMSSFSSRRLDSLKGHNVWSSSIIVDMGYRYLRGMHDKIQIQLLKSLRKVLSNSNCLGLGAWSEIIVESGQFQSISNFDDETSLYFLDENDELLCITFPAILDLYGKYSRVSSYFSFRDQENVSSIFYFLFVLL